MTSGQGAEVILLTGMVLATPLQAIACGGLVVAVVAGVFGLASGAWALAASTSWTVDAEAETD